MKQEHLEFFKNAIEGVSEQGWESWFSTQEQELRSELPLSEFLKLKRNKLAQAAEYLREAKISFLPLALSPRLVVERRLRQRFTPARLFVCATGLLAATGSGISIWDVERGEQRALIEDMDPGTHQGVVIADLSPDGRFLASGMCDGTTKVYDTKSGERLAQLSRAIKDRFNSAEQLCFSSDSSTLAASLGRRIDLFDAADWSKKQELKGHTSKVHLMQFAPTGDLLVSGAGRYVKLWDARTGAELDPLPPFKRLLGSLAVSGCGSILAVGGEDHTVTVWSLSERRLITSYKQHESQVFGVAASHDGSLIASSEMNGALHLWSVDGGKTLYQHNPGCASRIAFSPDGKHLAAATAGSRVSVIETSTASCVGILPASADVVFIDNQRLACADGEHVVVWQICPDD